MSNLRQTWTACTNSPNHNSVYSFCYHCETHSSCLLFRYIHFLFQGLFPFIAEPNGRTHIIHQKDFIFANSLLIGRSGKQACDDAPKQSVVDSAKSLGGLFAPNDGYLGMTSTQFMGSGGDPTTRGLGNWMSEFSNGGVSHIESKWITQRDFDDCV